MMEKNTTRYWILLLLITNSILTLLPFLTHSIYWINPYLDIDIEVLGFYNFSFLICGLICMHFSITSERSSLRIPLLCLAEVAVNYYSYCTDYDGSFCERGLLSEDLFWGSKLSTLFLTGSILVISVTMGLMSKTRPGMAIKFSGSIKKNAATIHDSDNSEDEAISMMKKKKVA
jgi:hypothetical protein